VTNYILPFLVLLILIYSAKKINVYEAFIEGTKEAFSIIVDIFPCLLSFILAINILNNSQILSNISSNANILSMIIMRPLSGNASLGILNNIYKINGPDSFLGFFASLIQATSDTTFYVITLYFGSIGIKKIRYAPIVCLVADTISIILAFIIAKLFFWFNLSNSVNRASF